METSLNAEQLQLLDAVDKGRVHHDARIPRPDWEVRAEYPFGHRRAGQRLAPLMRMRLVELAGKDEADANGVRLYKLTKLGEQIRSEAHEQESSARTEAGT